jgi:succinyl-diaminopimelate desuccinylase
LAWECLVVMGSRSRDPGYLGAIEAALAERPSLVFYRVLFGPPHHQVLKDHLDHGRQAYAAARRVETAGRGVLRAKVHVHGVAGHSGSSAATPSAIAKAAALISRLHDAELPGPAGPGFPLPARLTVTAVSGGEGYSAVPDLCTLNVDVRLTPALDDKQALALLRSAAAEADAAWPGTPPTGVEVTTCWPPFALPEDSPLRAALVTAARQAGLSPAAKVAGPSSIGNYLAGLGIPATAGLGVAYRGLHGTDEQVDLASIPPVQAAYHHALLTLLRMP